MNVKPTLSGLIALFALSPAVAQDRLYTRDGAVQEVKIKEVGTRTVIYKKWNNPDGPDFVLPKNEVERIKFQNGDEENFGRRGDLRPEKGRRMSGLNYGKNIISFSPIHMTNSSPIGFGISYERVLDAKGVLSFYLPLVYSFKNNGDYYNYPSGTYVEDKTHMAWFYPGLKVYPTGSSGVVRYAVGPSLAFGTGDKTYHTQVFDPLTATYITQQRTENVFVMGILVNNSLNIQPTPKLHLGLELGLGIPYYTDEKRDNGSGYTFNTYNDEPLVQFNFHIGYRF